MDLDTFTITGEKKSTTSHGPTAVASTFMAGSVCVIVGGYQYSWREPLVQISPQAF